MVINSNIRPSWRSLVFLWLPSLSASLAVFIPILYLALRAFQSSEKTWALVLRVETFSIVIRSLALGISVTILAILIALPLAWFTARTDLPNKWILTILAPLPLVIPSYVGAYLFASVLGPKGLLQTLLEQWFGLTRLPDLYGFPGALFVLTLLTYPFVFLPVRAAISRLDPALEEAARSLGENQWGTFWRVILPQLWPAITSGGLLVLLYVLRDFGAVSIMRFNTFTRVIYIQYQNSFDRTAASIYALILVLLSLLILYAESKSRGRKSIENNPRNSRLPSIIALNSWRWPAFVFSASTIFFALIMPAAILIYWLQRGLEAGLAFNSYWQASINSISASAIAALLILLFAIPVAYLEIRRHNFISHILERSTYISFALPGIVIALSLVFFGANFANIFYQTIFILLLAYFIQFLPEAIGSIKSSFMQIHPSLEEAGRSLGKNPAQVFSRITLPLIRPGLGSAFALVFLTAMKELPATLILAPAGFKTLSTSVWSAVSEAFFAQAAAPALLIILISSVPSALLLHRTGRER